MLRTVASPGTFGCHDCGFFHKCTEVTDKADTLRIVVHPSPPAFCASEGRKRHASLHWQGVARAKRAQRPLLRGESSGPQITPGESPDDISGNFFFPPTKSQKTAQKTIPKKQGFFWIGISEFGQKGTDLEISLDNCLAKVVGGNENISELCPSFWCIAMYTRHNLSTEKFLVLFLHTPQKIRCDQRKILFLISFLSLSD